MSKAITTKRFKSEGIAECEQCQKQGDWTRERARQHADRFRHSVRFVIEDVTVYAPKESS